MLLLAPGENVLAQAATPDAHEQLKSGKQQRKAQIAMRQGWPLRPPVAVQTNTTESRPPLRGREHSLDGEFDPGSGQTLAACVTHASRTRRPLRGAASGGRVSNTWSTYPTGGGYLSEMGDNPAYVPTARALGGKAGRKARRRGRGARRVSYLAG